MTQDVKAHAYVETSKDNYSIVIYNPI